MHGAVLGAGMHTPHQPRPSFTTHLRSSPFWQRFTRYSVRRTDQGLQGGPGWCVRRTGVRGDGGADALGRWRGRLAVGPRRPTWDRVVH